MTSCRAQNLRRRIAGVVLLVACVTGLWLAASRAGGPRDVTDAVTQRLACPVCAGQTVAESRTPVALAMRAAARQQAAAGRSQDEILAWFVTRYGPAVLLDPPKSGRTAPLWVVPLLVIAGGGALVVSTARGRKSTPVHRGGDVPLPSPPR